MSRAMLINLRLLALIVTLGLTSTNAVSQNSVLRPFTSDGCSSFPDGTLSHKQLWLSCCTAHDFAYWQGGVYSERLKADYELKQCVSKVGEPAIATIMLAGVRVGGSPYFPTQFRWGYGWRWQWFFPRGYKEISLSERSLIQQSIEQNSSIKTN